DHGITHQRRRRRTGPPEACDQERGDAVHGRPEGGGGVLEGRHQAPGRGDRGHPPPQPVVGRDRGRRRSPRRRAVEHEPVVRRVPLYGSYSSAVNPPPSDFQPRPTSTLLRLPPSSYFHPPPTSTLLRHESGTIALPTDPVTCGRLCAASPRSSPSWRRSPRPAAPRCSWTRSISPAPGGCARSAFGVRPCCGRTISAK